MRFRDSINTLPGEFCCNGLGWHDCMISLSAGPSIGLEESPLLAKPALSVAHVVLHDLRPECKGQLVVLTPRRCDTVENALRPGSDMLVNDSSMVLQLSRRKQRRLRRTGRRVLVDRVQDGVFDNLARRCRRCRRRRIGCGHRFAVWRNWWRHGQRLLRCCLFAIAATQSSHCRMALMETVVNDVGW